jgi:hypothetical protein
LADFTQNNLVIKLAIIHIQIFKNLSENIPLIGSVDDRKTGLKPELARVNSEQSYAQTMKRRNNQTSRRTRPGSLHHKFTHAVFQFVSGLIRERKAQHVGRCDVSDRDQVRDPISHCAGLAAACTGEHQKWAFVVQDGFFLS